MQCSKAQVYLMKKSCFLEHQYTTLREEIKECKARIFKIAGFGIFVVPAVQFLSEFQNIGVVLLTLPLLVITIVLLFLAENHGMMRCGSFIKDVIEPNVLDDDLSSGWEHWLEAQGHPDRRSVERYVSYGFYILFSVYYLASVWLAVRWILDTLQDSNATLWASGALAGYIAIGLLFATFLFANIRNATTTNLDK